MKPQKPVLIAGLLLLLGLLSFSFFYKLSYQPVNVWDEARRANDSLQILLDNDWVIDFYDDNPQTRSTKSPILLWLQAISLSLFGINEWALRFPSAAASVCIGLILWYFGNRFFKSAWAGVIAGSVFASTIAWISNHAGRTGDYDAFLVLFTTLYSFSFFKYCLTPDNKWLRRFWIFITLAVLIKGVAGLFFTPGLLIFALLQKRFKTLLHNRLLYTGGVFFVLVIGGYYLFRELNAPGFLQAVYNNELGGRYLAELEENGQPPLFYFKNFFWRFPFWIFLIVPAFITGYFHASKAVRQLTLFNFILTASFLLIISSSKTKLAWYDLPVYPLFSIQIAVLLYTCWGSFQNNFLGQGNRLQQYTAAAMLYVSILAFPFYFVHKDITESDPLMDKREQGFFLQQSIKNNINLNKTTFLYNGYDRHIRYYIKRLRLKNMDTDLVNNVKAVRPGRLVVVSQEDVRQQLNAQFVTRKKEEQHGCTVYYVEAYRQPEDRLVQNISKNSKTTSKGF